MASKDEYKQAHRNLGVALAKKGMLDEPIAQFRKTLELRPDYTGVRVGLAIALYRKGRLDESIVQLQEAIRLKPDNIAALNQLALELASRPRASAQTTAPEPSNWPSGP